MREKNISTALLALTVFFCGIFSDRIVTLINAATWNGLVQKVNSVSPDSSGNVNVTTVNGHSVDSSVPNSANFDQYDLNGSDIETINTTLYDLTATAEDVAPGKSAIIHGGTRLITEEEFNQLQHCQLFWDGSKLTIGDGEPCVIAGAFDTSATSATVSENVYAPKNSTRLFSALDTDNLDIKNLHTEYVENMSYMFYDRQDISLDLSTFNTVNVTNMDCMFSNCQNIETIYIGRMWNTDAVTSSSDMFNSCTKLPNFDSSIVDKTKAHTGADGYLTLKN